MSDPDFLAERRRVREQLEHLPGQSLDRARLATLRAAMDEEFDRRAVPPGQRPVSRAQPAPTSHRDHPRRQTNG